jgi:squalene-hopene/tetraprenyl-beta-curcumene cyclase
MATAHAAQPNRNSCSKSRIPNVALMPNVTKERIGNAYAHVRALLEAERTPAGHWIGELSTSALSTATAISAMALLRRHGGAEAGVVDGPIEAGLNWLAENVNQDGGWGDTTKSYTNIATTMLGVAALQIAGNADTYASVLEAADSAVERLGRLDGLRARYGKDKTFAVPILTNCALAGSCDWSAISPLPFELACLPQSWYRFAQLPVVSYAIPALVAIGQARHFHQPSRWPWIRWLRQFSVEPSLRVLLKMQPQSGGYLEAVPLTSFVVMSLASMGRGHHPVAQNGLRFLLDSVLEDGSWPIDTNLATWNTTLAINACAGAGERVAEWDIWDWVLSCQHIERHPFTGADPGGWGWTDLSGAVPDADDTPGALLALRAACDQLEEGHPLRAKFQLAALAGLQWLLGLQNRDGGWPTFCRGWGKLPFDRSGSDLTAHAMRAIDAWRETLLVEQSLRAKADRALSRGAMYLTKTQHADGSWLPLWFGNQDHPRDENPIYGTSKVLLAYRDLGRIETSEARRGLTFLGDTQNNDGGWGDGPSSVEETALAVEAILAASPSEFTDEPTDESTNGPNSGDNLQPALQNGLRWLVEKTESGGIAEDSPIGFYFAKLWYHERLYPLIFAASALGRATRTRSTRVE